MFNNFCVRTFFVSGSRFMDIIDIRFIKFILYIMLYINK